MKLDNVIYNCSSSFLDECDLSTGSDFLQMCEKPSKIWRCPWGGSAIIDDIAPAFKTILKENYSSSTSLFETTEQNMRLWWDWRINVDRRLAKFLRCTTFRAYFASFLCS